MLFGAGFGESLSCHGNPRKLEGSLELPSWNSHGAMGANSAVFTCQLHPISFSCLNAFPLFALQARSLIRGDFQRIYSCSENSNMSLIPQIPNLFAILDFDSDHDMTIEKLTTGAVLGLFNLRSVYFLAYSWLFGMCTLKM